MRFKSIIFWQTFLLSVLIALTNSQSEKCKQSDQEFFVTFHPHMDAFWLNTDDQLKTIDFRPADFLYAMNQRNSKTIFNSMYEALKESPARKYFVTQAVFFKDWYDSLNSEKKQKTKFFITSGQLQIVNGGWVENDEAVCYVDDILDQYTLGHNFLRQTFGIQTKTGWATDSFGHSHSQAALEHLLGFQSQGIQRIDERYIYQRKNGSLLQFYWSPVSDSNGRKYGGVYTHIRHFLHQFVDYRDITIDNLVKDYQDINVIMNKLYKRNKLFRFVGNDFQEFIPKQFTILEETIKKLNQDSQTECPTFKYGNPSDYFASIQGQQTAVPVRQSDFMPNYDQEHYWSGYFTTNPMLKVVCKDFSRLTNLFRKILVNQRIKSGKENDDYREQLKNADQLLAVMQHHDGITATSKYAIQELFRQRMIKHSESMIKAIVELKQLPQNKCFFDLNRNKCEIELLGDNEEIFLTVVHQGAQKQQKIEIDLPTNQYFQAQVDQKDSIFCNENNGCTLLFNALIKPGTNVFKLKKISPLNSEIIFKATEQKNSKYIGKQFTIEIIDSTVKYTMKNGDFISFSLQRATSSGTSVETKTWNKYGETMRKQENRIAGIYIMANNGKLESYSASKFTNLKVTQGKKHVKVVVVSKESQITLTIEESQPTIIELQTVFQPSNLNAFDYFIRIGSKVKSNGVFYHDMNGYLVSKRKIGQRLDYNWDYRHQDKINANTYPMCSFGYTTDGESKLVVFTDRPQGFTTYDDDLLINIDRLAYDDYKGVGEGYSQQIQNTFRHKVALIPKNQFIQRLWQRKYDELVLGFLSTTPPPALSKLSNEQSKNQTFKWVKYTTFSLNKNQFLLRFFNLNENEQGKIPKYTAKTWKLRQLGLSLKFKDIVQTFANGNPLSSRKKWVRIQEEVSALDSSAKDTAKQLILEPLQIRTFRINLKERIPWNPQKIENTENLKGPQIDKKKKTIIRKNIEDNLAELILLNPKPMKKHLLTK